MWILDSWDRYEYLWADGKDYPRPTRVPARQYIELLLNWVEGIINDDSVFPNSTEPFPSNFRDTVKPIFKRMFRVYAHIYFHHWDRMVEDSVRDDFPRVVFGVVSLVTFV